MSRKLEDVFSDFNCYFAKISYGKNHVLISNLFVPTLRGTIAVLVDVRKKDTNAIILRECGKLYKVPDCDLREELVRDTENVLYSTSNEICYFLYNFETYEKYLVCDIIGVCLDV